MLKIIQWNINGYNNNYYELQLLIKEQNPDIVCLQETHFQFQSNVFPPTSYYGYFHNLNHIDSSKQGIAVLIKKHIPHRALLIKSAMSVQGFEIHTGFKFTLFNMYIPPNQQFSSKDIIDIVQSISSPVILLGDFNSWSTLWGSSTTNRRGKIFEQAILETNLMVLNDGSPTHLSTHRSFSHIDLTLCSTNIPPNIE